MRTMFAMVIVSAGLGAVITPTAVHGQRIAYLNSQAIVAQTPGAQEAQAQIQQEAQRLDQRLKMLQDSDEALLTDYQRQSVLLSPEEKKRREDQIVAKRQAWNQRAQILQQEAQNRQQELMAPIMSKVEAVIEAVRKERDIAIIFDAASGAMVSADTTLDLTTVIIDRLKAQASGNSPSASR